MTGKPSPFADLGVSPREAEVLGLVGEDLTNAEIGARLYISVRTVESHVSSLLRKLGAVDRRQLAAAAVASTAAAAAQPPPRLPPALELLADASGIVGRLAERDTLRQQWRLARMGRSRLVMVTAEAGMGKSRLVAELATEVHADGGRVLLGACYEDVDQPYGPFVQAIIGDAIDLDADEVRRRVGAESDALTRLSSDLRRVLAMADERSPRDFDVFERGAVVDGIWHWLLASASLAPLLVVVEDLHWSTSTTRDVIRDLVRRADRAPLLVVVTARDSAPDLDADLESLLADLERAPSVERIVLSGFDRDEVAEFVGVAADKADSILAETGGNPLLVTHMTANDRRGSLRVLLSRRDRLLDEEARAVLDLAATFGAEFDADLLAVGRGSPLLSVLESLEAAEAAGLVVPHPGRPGRFAFVHALFRSHRYDSLSLRRRLQLHAEAAAALATRPGDDGVLSEWARHACLAVPVSDARLAVDLVRQAAHEAEHAFAYDEAVAHYQRGLEAAHSLDPPDRHVLLDLTARMGAALNYRGDPRGLPMLRGAARRARAEGDDDALVLAATSITQFGLLSALEPPVEGREITEAALAVVGEEPSAARARLLMDLATYCHLVDIREALELARRAEAIARELGDPDLLGGVLLNARHLVSHPGRLDDRMRIGIELERLGRQLGSLALTLAGLSAQAYVHLARAALDTWIEQFDQYLALLGERGLGFFQLLGINHRAQRAFVGGDLTRAEELAEMALPLSMGIGARRSWPEFTIHVIRRLEARDGNLRERYERAARRSSDAAHRCMLAAVQARSGRSDDALSTLGELRDEGFLIAETYTWSLAITELAEAAEVVGDPVAAGHVLAMAGAFSGQIAVSGPSVNRPFDQALAQAALAVGDDTAAASYATRAVTASRSRETPAFLVRELVFLAEARRRGGASAAEIRPLVGEALALAERIGARVVAADVERYGLPS
jgi:DNA-binding CsgD family transcriptional regulator